MSLDRRLELFRLGSQSVKRLFGRSGLYICPICGNAGGEAFARTGALSLEHVPPRSMGGLAIALTCRPCNNRAGYTIEAELHRREKNWEFIEFVAGRKDAFDHHVPLQVGDDKVRARLVRDLQDEVTTFEILGGSNDPEVLRRVQRYMSALSDQQDATGEEFGFGSGITYDPRLAKIAELKSAFLVAFAALGYRYALSRALRSVRLQILRPAEEVIPTPWTLGIESDERNLLVLSREPKAVVVKTGRFAVLLPWLSSSEAFYEEANLRYGPHESFRLTGDRLRWPKTLELVLDGGAQDDAGE